jgi:hypothetical protein
MLSSGDNVAEANKNVVALPVKPRTMHRSYRGVQITLTFIVGEKKWKWRVVVKQELAYEDYAPTDVKALRAAEKFIDGIKKGVQ